MSKRCIRCEGNTKAGPRCKRKASCRIQCQNLCWQHADDYKRSRGCSSKRRKSPTRRRKSPKKKGVRFSASTKTKAGRYITEASYSRRVPSKELQDFWKKCDKYENNCDQFKRDFQNESARSKRAPATRRFYTRCAQRAMCEDPYR